MNIVIFCHSLLSDWNHGNAHFLRGVVSELLARGHTVRVYEPQDAWSLANLLSERTGKDALQQLSLIYPALQDMVHRYEPGQWEVSEAVRGADLVLVHEWNDPALVQQIGQVKAAQDDFVLLFHDTHHRAVSEPEQMARYDLSYYDGVLAFGEVLRKRYMANGWARRAWTWHEAADTRVFHPLSGTTPIRDLVWVGNWGDNERTAELHEFLLEPVKELHLAARIHGVRYPQEALAALAEAGIDYAGWLPNFRAPEAFAEARVTVHVPRRPYVEALPGIPTIRVFEALACGIPLISAPWEDAENLFTPGQDFLVAANGSEMKTQLRRVLSEPSLAEDIARCGMETVRSRHTCAHRVDELLHIYGEIRG